MMHSRAYCPHTPAALLLAHRYFIKRPFESSSPPPQPQFIMHFLSTELTLHLRCMLLLASSSLISFVTANLVPSIPAPSAFRAVADARWTPQYRLGWTYSDTIDYLYFEVARNCSDGRSVFIRVDDKSMTDYFDIKSLRCTYAVRAVSLASSSPFSPSVTVGFGGLPSAPQSILSVLPTKANTLQVHSLSVVPTSFAVLQRLKFGLPTDRSCFV